MNSLEELFEILPAVIIDEGDEFFLRVEKVDRDDFMAYYSNDTAIIYGSPHGDTAKEALTALVELLEENGRSL